MIPLLYRQIRWECKSQQMKMVFFNMNIWDDLVSYLIFVGALVFELLTPPLDQILTTSEWLCKVSRGTY